MAGHRRACDATAPRCEVQTRRSRRDWRTDRHSIGGGCCAACRGGDSGRRDGGWHVVSADNRDRWRRRVARGTAAGGRERARTHPDYSTLGTLTQRVRRMFGLDADPERIGRQVACFAAAPGLRLPVVWDGFGLSPRTMLGELAVAALIEAFGRRAGSVWLFPSAAALRDTDGDARDESAGRTVIDGAIRFDPTSTFDDLTAHLTSWVTEHDAPWIALRTLGEPDTALLGACSAWRPWRSYGPFSR
jgi:hypothetical protein